MYPVKSIFNTPFAQTFKREINAEPQHKQIPDPSIPSSCSPVTAFGSPRVRQSYQSVLQPLSGDASSGLAPACLSANVSLALFAKAPDAGRQAVHATLDPTPTHQLAWDSCR